MENIAPQSAATPAAASIPINYRRLPQPPSSQIPRHCTAARGYPPQALHSSLNTQNLNRSTRTGTISRMGTDIDNLRSEYDDDPGLQEFFDSFYELQNNVKIQITVLTELTEEYYSPESAPRIVDMITRRLKAVPNVDIKVTILYLIDSICKNSSTQYRTLFEKKIVELFGHVYERLYARESMRENMKKLRFTWGGIYSHKTLVELDKIVASIDSPHKQFVPGSTVPSTNNHHGDSMGANKRKIESLPSGQTVNIKKLKPEVNSSQLDPRSKKNLQVPGFGHPPPADLIPLGAAHHTSVVTRQKPEPMIVMRNQAIAQTYKNDRAMAVRQPDVDVPVGPLSPLASIPDVGGGYSQPIPPPQARNNFYPVPPQQVQAQPPPHPFASHPQQQQPPMPYPGPPPQQPPPPPQASHGPPPPMMGPDSVIILINDEERRLFFVDNKNAIVLDGDVNRSFEQLVQLDPLLLRPRKTIFQGEPVMVIIDRGTPAEQSIRLDFNDSHPAQVFIPGIHAPQEFELGLPSRELIINGNPFQIMFGGPPIEVWLDDDQCHLIHLTEPTPLIRTLEDLRYDLWNRLIGQFKHLLPPPMAPSQAIAPMYGQGPPPPQQRHQMPPYQPQVPVPPMPQQHQPPQQQRPPMTNRNVQQQAPVTTNKKVDINALLSKIQTAGLFPAGSGPQENSKKAKKVKSGGGNKKGNAKSEKQAPISKVVVKPGPAPDVRHYVKLDEAEVKRFHGFVVDQSYNGGQCTNCSLRFSNKDRHSDVEGKKSKYARHLDWHFRMNSREKTNPVQIPRRQFFLNEDQWMQFKEIFDDEEEDVNNPYKNTGSPTDRSILEFPLFRAAITDYDSFIDAINYKAPEEDENQVGERFDPKMICTMVTPNGSDQRCTICNEKMENKWIPEHEEWRIVDAVKYRIAGEDEDEIYHSNCLKDLLLEDQGKAPQDLIAEKDDDTMSQTEDSEPVSISGGTGSGRIPGLDDTKLEESTSISLSAEDLQDKEDLSLDVSMNSEKVEDEQQTEQAEEPEANLQEVFEIEIPETVQLPVADVEEQILEELREKEESTSKVADVAESINEEGVKSPKDVTEEQEKMEEGDALVGTPVVPIDVPEPVKEKPKKRTGGIVIRMKKNALKVNGANENSNDVLTDSESRPDTSTPTPTLTTTTTIKSEFIDDECSRSSFTNSQSNSTTTVVDPSQNNAVPSTSCSSPPPPLLQQSSLLSNGHHQNSVSVDDQLSPSQHDYSPKSNELSSLPEFVQKQVKLAQDSDSLNYFSRGRETASACTIM